MRSPNEAVAHPALNTLLHTPRLLLRPPQETDVGAFLRAKHRNQEYLRPWSPAPLPGHERPTLMNVAKDIAQIRTRWRRKNDCVFCIFSASEPESQMMGRVDLSNIVRGVFQNAYLGYWMDRDMQGLGLMTEAVGAVIDFAFGTLRLHRVQAAVMPRNAGSLRVLEKIGFRREGMAERYLKMAGQWEDHILFALTSDERSLDPIKVNSQE